MANTSGQNNPRYDDRQEQEPLLSRTGDYGGSNHSAVPSYMSSGRGDELQSSVNGKHCHKNTKNEGGMDKTARRKLITACVLCLLFMIVEVVGGIIANSLAIATDAAHLLTDFASFCISLFSMYIASRPATKRMSFGWYRAEVMGALVSVLMIWVVTAILVYIAIQRVISGDYEIDASIMLITAGIGVAFNLIMGMTLHDSAHGHSHGGVGHGHSHGSVSPSHSDLPSHGGSQSHGAIADTAAHGESGTEETCSIRLDLEGDTAKMARKQENINVRAAFIHVLGDLLQSIGVLVAAYIIYYKPEWKIADPICTFLFSVLVLGTTITILRETLHVLMEGTPRGISFSEVKNALCSIDGVKELHNLRLWSLTLNKTALSVHLALEKDVPNSQVLGIAEGIMREQFGVHECTIQIEEYVDEMDDCTHCQGPSD